ncbi:MAG: hypothetical protein FJ009_21765 [Chloroflexi bacterium]|nr:hypothetical protein [Chloroflexota bacterium]
MPRKKKNLPQKAEPIIPTYNVEDLIETIRESELNQFGLWQQTLQPDRPSTHNLPQKTNAISITTLL